MKTIILPLAIALATASVPARAQTLTPLMPNPVVVAPDYIAQLRGNPGSLSPAEQIARNTVTRVPLLTGQLFQAIRLFAVALWRDPSRAQAVVDSLGEKAAPLFISYGEMAGPLAVIDPATYATMPPVPAGYAWSIVPPQADGTWPVGQRSVVITYTAPALTPSPTP